jgi:hypothetical protein
MTFGALAPPHSMTSSVRASNDSGTSRPSDVDRILKGVTPGVVDAA